jgi:hypothetical protein
MEQKFKIGDIVKIKTSSERVMVIEYKINHTGGIINSITRQNKYPKSVITDDVLCEGTIDKKFQRKYIKEANLEFIEEVQ